MPFCTMKKTILSLSILFLLAGCAEEGLEAKREELKGKEKELAALQEEIALLKKAIEELDTGVVEVKEGTPVSIKRVGPEVFEHFLRVSGTVESRKNVLLSAEYMGRVTAIPVVEGQEVSRGTVLVRLNDEAVRNQYEEAQAAFELARTTYQRRARLWEDSVGSEIEYLNAETNFKAAKNRLAQIRAQLDNTVIAAPIDGQVDEITVNVGEYLSAGTPVVRVVDLSRLEVEAEISENYLTDVSVGDTVKVSFPAIGSTQTAPLAFVGQYINPDNRSFKVKVDLKPNPLLKPNLLAELHLRDYRRDSALVVPAIAIKRDLRGEYLYVLKEDAGELKVSKRYIRKGRSFADQSEVLEGLNSGDRVVITGFNQVSDGDRVRIK